MLQPTKLQPGDRVAVIAPAGFIASDALDQGLQILNDWGLEVVVGRHVYEGEGFFSASDNQRLEDFQHAIDDETIRAIFIARGGFGLGKILDNLNFKPLLANPRWIIGFSDITLLHFKLHQLGILSIHGPMVKQMGSIDPNCTSQLKEILFSPTPIQYEVDANRFNKYGKSEGVVIGGNLSLITNNIGTSSDIDFDGKILLLEDVNEPIYALDRHLNHLQRANKLHGLKGVIVGEFSEVKDTTPPYHLTLNQLFLSYFSGYDYPILFDFPAGHGQINMPVPISSECRLSINQSGGLVEFDL